MLHAADITRFDARRYVMALFYFVISLMITSLFYSRFAA